MTQELKDRLQTHLGGYTLERELGGGGMSRVFVGTEDALGRRVVVKVLPPELAAGVNLERFRREIQVAAQLQHPLVVPVLAAGVADGLPFFTMPFVEGESLRTRLKREGHLSAGETRNILRDVADALAYAHARGIVHRDIKPDNVLLAGSHALVTDFGVAKALSAAKDETGDAELTVMGTTMGTPAYMAPEQAAADPDTDHRADIYSLGILGYELLIGRTPFGGRTPQATLAGHLAEPPRPLSELRPDVPPALEAIIMRCLAKRPGDRPQSAHDVVEELERAVTPGTGTLTAPVTPPGAMLPRALLTYTAAVVVVELTAKVLTTVVGLPSWVLPSSLVLMALGLPVIAVVAYAHHPAVASRPSKRGTVHRWLTWKRAAWGGAAVLAAFALVVTGHLVLRAMGIGPSASLVAADKLSRRAPILVAEFASPSDSLLGSVVSEALRTDLGQSRVVTVVQPSQVRDALLRMQRPVTTHLDAAIARELAQREGIKAIVEGELSRVGTQFLITARLVGSDGEQLASFRESASTADDLIPAINDLSKSLREKIGESLRSVNAAPALDRVSTGSLPALRKYTQAVQALEVEGDIDRGVALLEEAIAADTNFAMAYRKLGVALSNEGRQLDRANEAIAKAFAKRDRLTERERYMTLGSYYTPRDPDRAIQAYQQLLDIDPNHRQALNNLALLYSSRRDYRRAEDLLQRALAADSSTYTAYLNLVDAQVHQGRLAEAQRTLDRLSRNFPKAPVGTLLRAPLLYLSGNVDSAIAVVRAYRESNPGNARVRAETGGSLLTAALIRGQLREAERLRQDVIAAELERGMQSNALSRELEHAVDEAWYLDRPERAQQMIDAALQRFPIDSLPPLDRPYSLLATAWALADRPDRAREVVQKMEAIADSGLRRSIAPVIHATRGAIALAERRPQDALREIRASDEGPCAACAMPYYAWAYDQAGMADSAIVAYERYLATPDFARPDLDAYFLAQAHKRLGELYDARGDRARAIEHFTKFIEQWKDADPELQPRVADAKRRLELLRREERS